MPNFRYLETFFHIFDLLIDIFHLACFLKELIEVPFLLNASFNKLAVLDGLYQVFQYSVICLLTELAVLSFFAQLRHICDNALSCNLFLIVKCVLSVMLVLFWEEMVVQLPFQLLVIVVSHPLALSLVSYVRVS